MNGNEIAFKRQHNTWNWVTDILYKNRKVGFIIGIGGTGIWIGDRFIESTDFRVIKRGKILEEIGQAKSLECAKALVLALAKQKQEIGKYR